MELRENRTKSRWTILLVLCLNEFAMGGPYAWSVFSGPMAALKGWDYGQVTLAYSLMLLCVAISGVVGGILLDRFGPRVLLMTSGMLWGLGWFLTGCSTSIPMLYLSFGLICGTASGLFYNPGIITAVRWYPDKKGFASGLVGGVVGAAALVIAPIANFLLNRYNVMSAFKIIGGAFFLLALATTWYITNPPKGWKPEGFTAVQQVSVSSAGDKTWREMLRDKRFYLIWITLLGSSVSGLMMIGHASSIGQELAGISPSQAALLVGILAVANFCGRMFLGMLSDKVGRYKIVMAVLLTSTATMLLMQKVTTFWSFSVAIVIVGICFGGCLAVFPTISSDLFGLKNMGLNYGITFTAYGIAAIVGPMAAAQLKHMTGSYTTAFIFAAACAFTAFILTCVVARVAKKSQQTGAK